MENYSLSDLDLVQQAIYERARNDFWTYRLLLNPKMKVGWWQKEVARVLQEFEKDLSAGKRPMYVIEAPPQHGKSYQIIDFITWLAGKNPDLRTIYTSFSERLGVRANLKCQRIYDSDLYKSIFKDTRINTSNTVSVSGQYLRNREIIEYVDHIGYFRNTTVRGSITGEALDLGIVDDPIKGREEAGSETIREKTWDWFTDDFFTRFSEDAGLLCILTRWHVDDPIGRLKDQFGDRVKSFRYPALAEKADDFRKEGDALFPEHKSKEFILDRKRAMASANFEALYQQNPQIIGGEIIKGSSFKRYTVLPRLKSRAIFADTAQKTSERHDYSVFQCWGIGIDGGVYLIDQIRGKWSAPDLEQRAVDFWVKHAAGNKADIGVLREMVIEDKASGTGLIQCIKAKGKIPVRGVGRTRDKLTRIMDVLGYIESGYVYLPTNKEFVSAFIEECEAFTADDSHAHDDQIDPMVDAINHFLGSSNRKVVFA